MSAHGSNPHVQRPIVGILGIDGGEELCPTRVLEVCGKLNRGFLYASLHIVSVRLASVLAQAGILGHHVLNKDGAMSPGGLTGSHLVNAHAHLFLWGPGQFPI
jgi:hypothetical protein